MPSVVPFRPSPHRRGGDNGDGEGNRAESGTGDQRGTGLNGSDAKGCAKNSTEKARGRAANKIA